MSDISKQLAEWRRVTEAATPEPWESDAFVVDSLHDYRARTQVLMGSSIEDAAFIAATRTAMPKLLRIAEAAAEVAEANAAFLEVSEACHERYVHVPDEYCRRLTESIAKLCEALDAD